MAPPAPFPVPRAPLDGGPARRARSALWLRWARWYERELGWTASAGPPVELVTGPRFDVLELPAGAGRSVLRRLGRTGAGTGPVALMGRRMRFLVAPGSAEELPGLLDWLEWGGVALDLTALGADGRMTAPVPPGWPPGVTSRAAACAAVWLRAPEPGPGAESSLPALRPSLWGGDHGGPCLARLVATAAVECHRARLSAARGRRPEPETAGPAARRLTAQRFASS